VSWANPVTLPHQELPGHLEEEPAVGPPSHFKVEERFHGFRMGLGYLRHDMDKATVWDMHQEECENAMMEAQWE